jgi:HEAT repeat protein
VLVLAEHLTDPDDTVRMQVADALRQLGPAAAPATPLFLERLRDDDEATRFHAIEMLEIVAAHSRPVVSRIFLGLTGVLHDPSALVRSRSSMALNSLADLFTAADAPVFEAVDNPDEAQRLAAIEALGFLRKDDARVLAALRQQLRDRSVAVRCAACVSLCKLGRPAQEVLPTLMALLNDSVRTTQFAAIRTLGDVADIMPEARDTLNSWKEHPNPALRACVKAALSKVREHAGD